MRLKTASERRVSINNGGGYFGFMDAIVNDLMVEIKIGDDLRKFSIERIQIRLHLLNISVGRY